MDNNKKKKRILTGVIIAIVLVVLVGLTYALWSYFGISENQELVAGDIYMKYTETSNTINIENAMPSKTYGDDYFEFTIEGKNTYTKPIWYEIVIKWGEEPEGRTTRIPDEFLRFRLTEQLPGEEEQEVIAEGKYENFKEGTRIWVNTIGAKSAETTITYKLYMWISDEMVLGSGDAAASADMDMETWTNDAFASVKVSVNGDFAKKRLPIEYPESAKKVLSKAKENNYIIDDEDDVLYFSGTNEEINFNYVWYSGKLWRITAIYPDGTIKMITQDEITAINWGSNTTYQGSWIYQWLNENFLDTLENQENIIVQDAKWNAAETTSTSKPDETTIVEGKVGLLNAYEYTQAYKNASTSTNYLNIGYSWWLITPYDSTKNVRYVSSNGSLGNTWSYDSGDGVRPSVNLKSDIKITGGDGSKEDPYRISGDKEIATVNDKLNSRVSGEYVNYDGKKYRIVGIENDTTKLTSVDYVRDGINAVMTKRFGSNFSWATSVSTDSGDTYWSGYLNNTWYNNISETYRKMLVQGTYYLGTVGSTSYKNTICSESNTTETTKECNKTSSTWEGYVGLPRVGEMFSAQLADKQNGSSSSDIWLITPYGGSGVRCVSSRGELRIAPPLRDAYGVRPSINLKSNVTITSGDGTEQVPYEIKCDTCGS